jgi:hypothetical protein
MQVATLNAGDSLGEIALQEECVRTATILTLEQSFFATLNKASYNSFFGKLSLLFLSRILSRKTQIEGLVLERNQNLSQLEQYYAQLTLFSFE